MYYVKEINFGTTLVMLTPREVGVWGEESFPTENQNTP